MDGVVDWAGVSFLAVAPWDAGQFRTPGLFAFVHRGGGQGRTLLYVGHADNLACALDGGHPAKVAALGLGYDELNLAPQIGARIDRLLLRSHIVRRCAPLLNLLEEGDSNDGEPAGYGGLSVPLVRTGSA